MDIELMTFQLNDVECEGDVSECITYALNMRWWVMDSGELPVVNCWIFRECQIVVQNVWQQNFSVYLQNHTPYE